MSTYACLFCRKTFVAKPSAKQLYCSHPCFAKNNTRHGARDSATYRVWHNMKERCKSHMAYAGRGITVCARWLASFENFVADMGEKPDGLSIDRINNDGNYEPENCRWATRIEQQANRRVTRRLTFNGKTQTLSAWSRELSLPRSTIVERMRTCGWTAEQALSRTTPQKGKRP